jgi:copper homeostasis protein
MLLTSFEPSVAGMSSSSLPTQNLLMELCTGGIDDVCLAAQFGVDRIELNSGMAVGGLTPSASLAATARRAFAGPIVAMIRPREGGFAYSKHEYLQMLNDGELLIAAGIEGLATGFLTSEGTVDLERCRKIRALFPKATLVFHRAFDVTPDFDIAIRQLIDCGFNRILTSGGKPTALEGSSILKRIHVIAAGRIEILPAGGIRASNILDVIKRSACNQFHTSAREIVSDRSTQHNLSLSFGLPGQNNGSYGRASTAQIEELLTVVKRMRHSDTGGRSQ